MSRLLVACACLPILLFAGQSPVTDRDWKGWVEDVRPLFVDNEAKDAPKVPAADREQYREAFWSRRNPDPQSAENAQRAEYEQRVRAADKGYRDGGRGRWNDCGRTFVLLGQPDRVSNAAASDHFRSSDRLAAMRNEEDSEGPTWYYRDPPRLPQAPNGYAFRFTQMCESLGGPAFHRMLDSVARTYVAKR